MIFVALSVIMWQFALFYLYNVRVISHYAAEHIDQAKNILAPLLDAVFTLN